MKITAGVRRLMQEFNLTEPMVRAIHAGDAGAIIDCNWRTEAALIERSLMRRVNSDLTASGQALLAALKAGQGIVEPAAKPVGGVVR